jgi:amino-acid N-acetyltransferase
MSALINGYARRMLMLPKSLAELQRNFREYVVLTDRSGALVGCAGLRVYRPELAEIVGLAVSEAWQGKGLGGVLIDRLIEEARVLGIARVFAMTLQEGVFRGHGFRVVPRSSLPEKVAADCKGCDRRVGCREIAMLAELHPPSMSSARSGRRLRILKSPEEYC